MFLKVLFLMLDCFCIDSLSNASYGFVIDKKENIKIDYRYNEYSFRICVNFFRENENQL